MCLHFDALHISFSPSFVLILFLSEKLVTSSNLFFSTSRLYLLFFVCVCVSFSFSLSFSLLYFPLSFLFLLSSLPLPLSLYSTWQKVKLRSLTHAPVSASASTNFSYGSPFRGLIAAKKEAQEGNSSRAPRQQEFRRAKFARHSDF